jgi:hypothetical protein
MLLTAFWDSVLGQRSGTAFWEVFYARGKYYCSGFRGQKNSNFGGRLKLSRLKLSRLKLSRLKLSRLKLSRLKLSGTTGIE